MRNKSIQFVSKGKTGFLEIGNPPVLKEDEILLDTLYSGITNGTERHALLTEHGFGGGNFPSRHGYQHVSEVTKVGASVKNYKVGDIVFLGEYIGHNAWNIIKENALMIKLPADIDIKYCALFGVAGVALRSIRRMGVSLGDKVWVVGQGPIGQFTAQAAKAAGAEVTVTDFNDTRLKVSKECGIHHILNAKESTTVSKLKELGKFDYIYDCCSYDKLLFDINNNSLLADSGTIGMMAVRSNVEYPWGLLHCGAEGRIETSCHFDKDDLRVLLFLYESNLLNVESAVSHIIPVSQAPEIYKKLSKNDEDLLGVIFEWK